MFIERSKTELQHFSHLSPNDVAKLFMMQPANIHRFSEKSYIATSIGAALYMPADRKTIAADLIVNKYAGLSSIVIDLEDALADSKLLSAEANVLMQLGQLSTSIQANELLVTQLPFIFIRIRNNQQLQRLISMFGDNLKLVTGFVMPKLDESNAVLFFEIIKKYNEQRADRAPLLYGIPILETTCIFYKESRMATLLAIRDILQKYSDYVLNIRIGATDFCSLLGLRRGSGMTIYDIYPIRDCLSDIINLFCRPRQDYVISGPVFEYFHGSNEAFYREVMLDKENGMIGKTVIHPLQILPVQSTYIVTHEEYTDAQCILNVDENSNGVIKSIYSNKMNEIKPHFNWAQKIMLRAEIYGVFNEKFNSQSVIYKSKQHYI